MLRKILQKWHKQKDRHYIALVVSQKNIVALAMHTNQEKYGKQICIDHYWDYALPGLGLTTEWFDKPFSLMQVCNTIRSSLPYDQSTNLLIALADQHICEKWYVLGHATSYITDFVVDKRQHSIWDFQYVYPVGTQEHAFYVCGIRQPLLMQYTAGIQPLHLTPTLITTRTVSLLSTYHYYKQPTFRSTQLAVDMAAVDYNITNLVSRDMIHRLVNTTMVPPITHDHIYDALAVGAGMVASTHYSSNRKIQ